MISLFIVSLALSTMGFVTVLIIAPVLIIYEIVKLILKK